MLSKIQKQMIVQLMKHVIYGNKSHNKTIPYSNIKFTDDRIRTIVPLANNLYQFFGL